MAASASKKSRKSPRALVSLVARYRSPTAFEFVQEECFDLSLGGMFIRSPAPAPAGTLIKLECDVNGSAGAIRGVARVVWLREHASDGQPAGMGVKFVKLDAGAREAIASVLVELGADGEERETIRPSSSPAGAPERASSPFNTTPSARPGAPAAAAPAAPAAREGRWLPSPVPMPLAARTNGAGGTHAEKVTPIELGLPAELADKADDAEPKPDAPVTLRPPKASKQKQAKADKASKKKAKAAEPPPPEATKPAVQSQPLPAKADAPSKAQTPGKPKRDTAARGANTLPPARERSNGLRYAGVIALAAAVGLFIVLSRQPPEEHADVVPEPELDLTAQAAVATTAKVAPSVPEPAPEPEPVAAAEPTPEPEPVAPQPPPRYVLDVTTQPPGARVTAGAQVLVAPGRLDLGQLDAPLALTAEHDGFEPAAATVDRIGFMLEDGAMRRRIELTLIARAAPVVATASPEPRRAPKAPEPEPKVRAKPARTSEPAAEKPAPRAPKAEAKAEPQPEPKAALQPEPEPAAAEVRTPMQAAAACLTSGDNACVIHALDGKAKSAREFELLIETYRALGENQKAERWMQTYLDKYPTERHSNTYRRLLSRRQDEARP